MCPLSLAECTRLITAAARCRPAGCRRTTALGAEIGGDEPVPQWLRAQCVLSPHVDKPRVNIAVAHKRARMLYFMLTSGEEYVDQGQQHYEEQQRQRSIAALKRRAAAMGGDRKPL